MPKNWVNRTDRERYFAHELAHIWDMRSGKVKLWGAVNGPGDALNAFINNGTGIKGWACRYCADTGLNHISDAKFIWQKPGVKPYGNNSTADYLADAFAWGIYEPSYIPSFEVTVFVEVYIMVQVTNLP